MDARAACCAGPPGSGDLVEHRVAQSGELSLRGGQNRDCRLQSSVIVVCVTLKQIGEENRGGRGRPGDTGSGEESVTTRPGKYRTIA
jgi:hypothetical protein